MNLLVKVRDWVCDATRAWSREIVGHGVPMAFGWLLTFSFSLYVIVVFTMHMEEWTSPPVLTLPFWLVLVTVAVIKSCLFVKQRQKDFPDDVQCADCPWHLGVFVFVLYSTWLVLTGTCGSADTLDQLRQIREFCFCDWHPILHTFSMYLFTRVYESLMSVAFAQILVFSFLVVWLRKSLSSSTKGRVAMFVTLSVALNPVNFTMLCLPWKDVAFALSALGLSIALLNVVVSKGEWICKNRNLLLFAVLFFLCTFYRHNGIFLTVPLCVGLLLWRVAWRVKFRLFLSVMAFVCMSVCYVGAKNSTSLIRRGIIDVQSDSRQKFVEAVGLPMCAICDVYVNSFDQAPESARRLMSHFGNRADLVDAYQGDYNSIKFTTKQRTGLDAKVILAKHSTLKEVLKIFVVTLKSAPSQVVGALRRVTAFVWDPMLEDSPVMTPRAWIARELSWPLNVILSMPLGWMFGSIGFWLLVLFAVATIGYLFRGWIAWLFSLPWLAYGFGTMCLLCGNDWRFFYAVVLCAPVSFVGFLFARRNK